MGIADTDATRALRRHPEPASFPAMGFRRGRLGTGFTLVELWSSLQSSESSLRCCCRPFNRPGRRREN